MVSRACYDFDAGAQNRVGVVMRRFSAACLAVMALTFADEAAGQQIDPLVANSTDATELQRLAVGFISTNQTRDALQALRKSLDPPRQAPCSGD